MYRPLLTRTFALLAAFTLSIAAVEASVQPNGDTPPVIVYIDGAKYYVHMVAPGETLYSISRRYGVDIDTILNNNPAARDSLRADMTLKIPLPDTAAAEQKHKRKDFEYYDIKKGETLYSISRSYGIPVDRLLADNADVDPSQLSVGQRLYIRKTAIGSLQSTEVHEQWENYRDNMNAVAPDGYFYYMVKPGETLYSLSRRYGITEQEVTALNKLPDGLKAGELLMLPLPEGQKAADEAVHDYDAEQQAAEAAAEEAEVAAAEEIELPVNFVPVGTYRPLRIALLLPLTKNGGAVNGHFLDFYRGFLLGAEDVKAAGYSIHIALFDTEQSAARTAEIVETGFDGMFPDLIVGPVYENEMAAVVEYAANRNIPVVSPLAALTSNGSNVVFQMSPDTGHKYDKAADLFDGSREVTLVYGSSTDKEFEREVLAMLNGKHYRTHKYSYVRQTSGGAHIATSDKPLNASDFTYLLRGNRNNVIVILTDNETEVDRIMSAIASAEMALRSRERTMGQFVVFGSSKLQRYNNLDHSIFFNNKLICISSYSARRDDARVRAFDDRYISDYNTLPSLYTYRGYDAAVIFGQGMFSDIERAMTGKRYCPLQTSYTFEPVSSGRFVNREWMRIEYRNDFTINVE